MSESGRDRAVIGTVNYKRPNDLLTEGWIMKCSRISQPRLSVGLVLMLLASCARSPDPIEAVQVSEEPYRELSCDELIAKDAVIEKQLTNAVRLQRAYRNADGATVILIPFMFLVLLGWEPRHYVGETAEENENLIAVLRGEAQAVNGVYRQHECRRSPT